MEAGTTPACPSPVATRFPEQRRFPAQPPRGAATFSALSLQMPPFPKCLL